MLIAIWLRKKYFCRPLNTTNSITRIIRTRFPFHKQRVLSSERSAIIDTLYYVAFDSGNLPIGLKSYILWVQS